MFSRDGRRKRGAQWFWALFLTLCAWMTRGEGVKMVVAPPPQWVKPVVFQLPAIPVASTNDAMRWLLKERQINVQRHETFIHETFQVLTNGAPVVAPAVLVDVDLGCQSLTFHWAKIWRGTNSINQLAPERFVSTIRPSGIDRFLFSGSKSAQLPLDDLRAGDVVDYAYTVSGENPALRGRFVDWMELQDIHPIERLVTRLLWPSSRRFYIQNHGTEIKPIASAVGAIAEYTWDLKRIAAARIEPLLPPWYIPVPSVELSEFQTWGDVNRWAMGICADNGRSSAELTRQIAAWKALATPEDRILAALAFVRDEIRPIGNEGGGALYSLENPSTVFQRRAGEDQDRNFLFLSILRALGIDASPVLVNTRMRQALSSMHPSPELFDRLIVQVNLDGQTYYLDAADIYSRGALAFRSWPEYQLGLVVHADTTALTIIPPGRQLARTTMTQYIGLGGFDQPAEWRVVTIVEGMAAEDWRQQFNMASREEIERQHLAYYAHFYPDIVRTRPMVLVDNDQQNTIEMDEFYRVEKMWAGVPTQTYYSCKVIAANLDAAMAKVRNPVRTMPLGLSYPEQQVFRAEVTVPTLAVIKPDEQTIENPAFLFHRQVAITPEKLVLEYDYRSLTDAVLPAAVPAYAQQLNEALDTLVYTINSD